MLVTRPSSLGQNMPATTTMPVRSAMARTPDAHGPSSGSATGANGTPKRHIVASGKSTSRGAGVGGAAGVVLDEVEVGRRFGAALDLRQGNPHASAVRVRCSTSRQAATTPTTAR